MQKQKELILCVDDDKGILESLEILLSDEFEILTTTNVNDANGYLQSGNISLVVVDLNFEGHENDGLSLIDYIISERPNIPFIVLSGDNETKRVVEAMKRPLIEFVTKDGDHDEILRLAIRKGLMKRRSHEEKNKKSVEFKTKSQSIKSIFRTLDKLLNSNSTASILINGESGTGKEYMAKYIANYLGKRLVAANMASIPRETAESELFGHIKGAFTGATSNKIGLIEQSHNGVFFLDEIGDCSPEIQAKLLRAIQEKEVLPVGATIPKKIETRFIAATHQYLNELVEDGFFRLDLQQRLSTFIFTIPPLRERPEDIEYYATMFLNELSQDEFFSFEPSAISALNEYSWPGNVRELRNTIERAYIYSHRRTIDESIIYKSLNLIGENKCRDQKQKVEFETLKTSEQKNIIMDSLVKFKGNKKKAASDLGIHFSTLHRRIKKLNIENIIPQGRNGRPKLARF